MASEVNHATFSVRLPGDMLKRLEAVAANRIWSRNRTIEQAILRGLSDLEEAAHA